MTGAYLGVMGGYDSVRLSADGESGSEGDFTYGVTLGYDFDLGNIVVGGEAELSDSSVSVSATDIITTGDVARLSADRDIYVGARLGAKVASSTLLYVKAGYTNAKVKLTYTDGVDSFSDGDTLDGYRVGAGVQQDFGGFAVRGEYRYSDYGNYKSGGVDTGLKAQRHQVVIALIGQF